MNKLVSLAAAAFISVGAIAGATSSAQAGKIGVGIWLGGPHVGIGIGGHHGWNKGYYGHCSKDEALWRAASMGMKKNFVSGVSDNRITVMGKRHGKTAKLVMFRQSPDCAVKSFTYV
jgi:hypothetical protein